MFRTAELGQKVPNKVYKEAELHLRQELLELQQQLLASGRFPVIILFAGVDGAGKGPTVNVLNEWMDPRWLVTRAYGEPTTEELDRPSYWRYWRDLPPKGRIGFFLSAWYHHPLLDRAYGRISEAEYDEHLDRILAFETGLARDGALILKFWMHLSRDAQKKRLKKLEKDPLLSWQVADNAWQHWRMYNDFINASERAIKRTSTGDAPVHVIEGVDANYRSLTVGRLIRDSIRERLQALHVQEEQPPTPAPPPPEEVEAGPVTVDALPTKTVLSQLDMGQEVNRTSYKKRLKASQARLNPLHRAALKHGVSTVMVFEGWDAAGKGGAIRRVTRALDARNYRVLPFAAPTDEERAQHYMWRFWRHLSRAGRVTVFDRSWYGRVLVERVEGFATENEWRRAYAEINDFEEQLAERGIVLLKFWIHITKEEQLARFQAREETPHKRWKLTEEDWRNREKWDAYEEAVNDMVERTSSSLAPWTLVEGNDKRFARLKVLDTVCNAMEEALERAGREEDR